jgi:hypothetical protein
MRYRQHETAFLAALRRLYGERLVGLSEMASRCALLAIDAGGRSIFRLMTPVGVFALASERSCFTSLSLHG